MTFDTDRTAETGGHSDTGESHSTLEQSGIILCEDPSLRESSGPFAFAELGPGWMTQLSEEESSEFQAAATLGLGLAATGSVLRRRPARRKNNR